MFEVRRVRQHDVLYVLMRDKRNWLKLGAWCRRQRIAADFELRNMGDQDVFFVILHARS
jgi:hypothetical protein